MRRTGKVAIAVGVGVVAALLIAWPIAAAEESHSIIATTDTTPYSCVDPADLTTVKFGGQHVAAIKLYKDLNCILRIRVYNDGILPASITRASFRDLGVYSDEATIDSIDGQRSKGAEDAVGLIYGETLAPGQTIVIEAHLTMAKRPCMEGGAGWAGATDEPHLTVSTLGIGFDRTPTNAAFAFVGTKDSLSSKCDDGETLPNNPYDYDYSSR